MAWIRQLDSGLWAATVYTPAGRRSKSHVSKTAITRWAQKLEADIDRGLFIDPNLAKTTVGEVWTKHGAGRRLEMASRKRDTSIYKNHVAPRWGRTEVGAILKPDVQEWVNDLEAGRVGGWTIIAALNVLKAICELAVDARMIRSNPARRVRPPMAPEHEDRVLDADEETELLAALDRAFPGRTDARLFVETLLDTGARWEEVAAIKREAVDVRSALIHIGPVMERDGTVRSYPKGARTRLSAGFRDVPISDELVVRLKPIVLATPAGGLLFTSPAGKPLRYTNWRSRVWSRVVHIPVLDDRGRPVRDADGKRVTRSLFVDPQPTPHDLRHTYGTRLADAGVEQHHRMALMGQKDQRSAQRYTHSNEERHGKARAALAAARGRPLEDRNSSVTHDLSSRS